MESVDGNMRCPKCGAELKRVDGLLVCSSCSFEEELISG